MYFNPSQLLPTLLLKSHLWQLEASPCWPLNTYNMKCWYFSWYLVPDFQDAPASSFYNSCIRPRISPFSKTVVTFDGKGYIKTTIWVGGIIISTRLVIVSRSFQWTETSLVYLCVCVYSHTPLHIFKYILEIHTDTSKSNSELYGFYHLLFCISNFSSSGNTLLLRITEMN